MAAAMANGFTCGDQADIAVGALVGYSFDAANLQASSREARMVAPFLPAVGGLMRLRLNRSAPGTDRGHGRDRLVQPPQAASGRMDICKFHNHCLGLLASV